VRFIVENKRRSDASFVFAGPVFPGAVFEFFRKRRLSIHPVPA
jgi:hypothetical protein